VRTRRTAWEPINEAHVWDRSDPCASFGEPCNNCAFRPGSPEQVDIPKWKEMIAALRAGVAFHCHKGVRVGVVHGSWGLAFHDLALGNQRQFDGRKTLVFLAVGQDCARYGEWTTAQVGGGIIHAIGE
jgi:hypothetical protein